MPWTSPSAEHLPDRKKRRWRQWLINTLAYAEQRLLPAEYAALLGALPNEAVWKWLLGGPREPRAVFVQLDKLHEACTGKARQQKSQRATVLPIDGDKSRDGPGAPGSDTLAPTIGELPIILSD
jgi:hypothetical protein